MRLPALLLAVLLPASGLAQVSCADPDDLCTGDPCLIPTLAVATPCVVDFGPRAVIVTGRLAADGSSAEISLTAGSIDVAGAVMVRGVSTGGVGHAAVSLHASGNIHVSPVGSVAVRGNVIDKDIELDAGGSVDVDGRLVAASGRARVAIDAGADVVVASPLRTQDVEIVAGGTVDVQGGIVALRDPGRVVVVAGGALVVARGAKAGPGGIRLQGASGVTVTGPLRAVGGFAGTTVEASSAAGGVALHGHTVLSGSPGEVLVQAAGPVTVNQPMHTNVGAWVFRLIGASVQVAPTVRLLPGGLGEIRIQATVSDVALGGDLRAAGGIIEATAVGNLTADGVFSVAPTGCIAFSAGGVLDTSGGTFDVPILPDCPG